MALFKCFKCKALQSFPMKNYIGWNLQKFSAANLTPFTVVVTQSLVDCLVYTPEAQGPQALRLRVYISSRPLVPVLQLLNVHQ